MDDQDTDPFVEMFCQQQVESEDPPIFPTQPISEYCEILGSKEIFSVNISRSVFFPVTMLTQEGLMKEEDIKMEQIQQEDIKQEPMQEETIAQAYGSIEQEVKLEKNEEEETAMSQFSESFVANAASGDPATEEKQKKKKGRPKGAKNTVRSNVAASKNARYKSVENNTSLPKMRQNVHNYKLKLEQVEELKKSKVTFIQPGVCFQIAPKLNGCKECKKVLDRRRYNKSRDKGEPQREVDCRFYQFRKLRYIDDELDVAGFLDPHSDPIDVDRAIWMPNVDKRVKTLSIQNARYILIHVGEQLCELIEKEYIYYQKYKSDEKPVIWKRLIE